MIVKKLIFCLSAALLVAIASAGTARADVIVMLNTNAGGAPVNLVDCASCNPVVGTTGAGNLVNFTGLAVGGGTNLEAESGAAIISAPGSSGSDPNLLRLHYELVGGLSFTSTQFNVDVTEDGQLRLTITGAGLDYDDVAGDGIDLVSNDGTTLVLNFDADSSGANVTNILAINGQTLNGITLEAIDDTQINLVRQIRINGDGPTTVVPEPATMLLLGTGLAGFAAKLRNRRRTGK